MILVKKQLNFFAELRIAILNKFESEVGKFSVKEIYEQNPAINRSL